MIFDHIKNIGSYRGLSDQFNKAVDFLMSADMYALPVGEVDIHGREVYGFVKQTSLSAENLRWEAHAEYADIQIILDGGEKMAYIPLSNQPISQAYDSEKDVLFYHEPRQGIEFVLGKGEFMVFMPGELHRPDCAADGEDMSRKLVIKVRM